MNKKNYNRIAALSIFIALPVLFYSFSDIPFRTALKQIISISTVLAFFMMLLQFFLSRANKPMLKEHKMGKVLKWHKYLGYAIVTILLIHPFLIVVPKYYEAGVDPIDAFIMIITQWSSKGIILGLIAWLLMIIIGFTSFFRNNIGLNYKTWRMIHGILSILFIAIASFHVVTIGRHVGLAMSVLISVLAVVGISLLLKIYLFKPITQTK